MPDEAGEQDADAPDGADHRFEVGQPVDEVKIDIDHAIIRHFSENLYSSPNKAIEELVSNGFDALATACYVYVPGDHVQERVLVWDNGLSMDPAGMQAMWTIARSPKGEGSRVAEAEGRRRSMIGKFGIGKLASYAVGHRISHICRTADDRYLSVSVNYRDLTLDDEPPAQDGSEKAAHKDDPTRTPIRELTAEQAEALVRDLLPKGNAVEFMLAQEHWTLAVIDDLKPVKLYPGRLMWVLGNGMPLRDDFAVWVEDKPVVSSLAAKAAQTWLLDEDALRDSIKSVWADAKAKGQVGDDGDVDLDPPAPPDGAQDTDDPATADPAWEFPTLGRVTAKVRIFEESLARYGDDEGRSYGFFLRVRGRLVNADDDKLLLHDPSFGTFYRSQYQIRADGLDDELLADRESLRRDTPMTAELKVLQQALYLAARLEIDRTDAVQAKGERPESRLPTDSRELFRDPVTALLARSEKPSGTVNLDEPAILRKELGEKGRLAEINPDDGHFHVNRTHPFYRAIAAQVGGGRKAEQILRGFDLFAVSERLTEGFLYTRGIADEQIADLFEWRDRLFRSLGVQYGRNPEDIILEVKAASVEGKARFEVALADLFTLMGYRASRHGESGAKDVIVVAPLGPQHRIFTVEAKGSKDAVGNLTAAISGAAAHRDAVEGAVHAVVVAREFTGFEVKDEPAILKECQSVKGVSVVTVDTLVDLYRALMEYSYPLDVVMDALFEVETPSAKTARVKAMQRPLEEFDYRAVLDDIWERQAGESAADVVPTRTLWQGRREWRHGIEWDVFKTKLAALDTLAGGLVVYDPNENAVHLRAEPQQVVDHVLRRLSPPPAS